MSKATRNVYKVKSNIPQKYSIIILAAGERPRMRAKGVRSLIQITHNETIIDRQINLINQAFQNEHREIILIAGYEAQRLMNYVSSKQYGIIQIDNVYHNHPNHNIIYSLSLGLRAVTTNNVIILHGDLIFNQATLNYQLLNESCLWWDNYGLMEKNDIGCVIHKGYVENIMYDLPTKWAQIIYLCGQELQLCKDFCWKEKNKNKFDFEVLNHIINNGGKLKAITPTGMRINDINSAKDLQTIRDIV